MRLRRDRLVERREEALERNTRWQGLTTREKMASLKARRGKSKRQMDKLSIAWSCELEAGKEK